jgi:cytochrome c-type biogenesis protein CcmH
LAGRVLITVVALALLGAPAATAQEPRASLPDVEDEVMCPICGVTLELATEAQQAERERAFIRGLIAEGLTKEQIKDRLVAEFGPEVLAVPDNEGFDLAAWLVPGAVILVAAGAIAIGLRRWRRDGGDGDDSKRTPGGESLDDADSQRLDADLARYKL